MNPVHAVLRNWDILQAIMNFVKDDRDSGHRDLVAVALVCRALSDLALDVLWRDINLFKLHRLFPMDMINVDSQHTKTLTCIPTTPQEWERFDVYAARIREIRASPYPNVLLLRGLRMRYPTSHHPFPNLTCLRWTSGTCESINVMILLCPTLVEVELAIEGREEVEDEKDVLADVLRRVGEKCSRLRKFECTNFSTLNSLSKAVVIFLVYLIRQCRRLEVVRLPVSRDILCALGSLPHLSTLRLDHVDWEDGSQLNLPIHADEWNGEADRFPVLDKLAIQDFYRVSSLTECFQGSGCFPRKSFTMQQMFESEPSTTLAFAEFFRGILRPDRSEGLQALSIDRGAYDENPMESDPWQALRCFSCISNLHTLTLEGLFLAINDSDLDDIPRIWPELQTLRLDVPYYNEYESQISFQGLAHLSKLENLETLSLMLAPESTISESMLSPPTWSNSRLKNLTIQGYFPPVPVYDAARFLILYFPSLVKIDTDHIDREENAWTNEIQVALDVARWVMNNLPLRLLNSRPGVAQEDDAH